MRHGFDEAHLFVFSVSDTALRDALVKKWNLRDLTGSVEDPVSFAGDDHPKWWPFNWPSATRKFGRYDEDQEEYWSIWEQPNTDRLYVQVGNW